jgi:hypothetical protein
VPAIILHDNGRNRLLVERGRLKPNLGPVYCRMLERQVLDRRGVSRPDVALPSNLDLVLCSTRQTKQYTERVLDTLGVTGYHVLGRHVSEWKHILKIQLILEHIERCPTPEILMHLDATDVLVVGELRKAVIEYEKESECELFFGAEKGSAPGSAATKGITTVERQFIEDIEDFEIGAYVQPFRHLNAGCFIGRKTAIRELFERALQIRDEIPITSVLENGNHLAEDDQLLFRELHRQLHPRVRIDHQCRVFQNLFGVKRSELAVEESISPGPAFLAELLKHLASVVLGRVRLPIRRRQ